MNSNMLLLLIVFIITSCGGGGGGDSFADLGIDDLEQKVVQNADCTIDSTNPATATVKVANAGTITTNFAVVPKTTDGCALEYQLNGVTVANDGAAFAEIASSDFTSGTNTLTVTSTGATNSDEHTWTVIKNAPPTCSLQTPSSTGNSVDYVNDFNFSITAADAENDPVTFVWKYDGTLSPSLFTGTSSAGYTSSTTFDPSITQVGTRSITVEVNDSYDTTLCSWTLQVNDPITASITAATPDVLSENPVVITSAGLNSTRTFTVTAVGTGITYSWLLDGTPIGGAISPALNLTSGLAIGTYALTARVEDAYGNTDTHVFNVKRNAPPELTVVNPAEGVTSRFNVATFLNYEVTGTDGNLDPITYTWTLDNNTNAYLPSGSNTTLYNPANDTGQLGSHVIKVTATDGHEIVEKSWNVDVNQFSNSCNNLNAGQICTLVGHHSIGDGVSVGVSENLNQSQIRIDPRNVIVEVVSGVDNLIFSDEANDVVWYYNRGSSSLFRFGKTVPAYGLKVILGSGQAGLNQTSPTKMDNPTGLALNTDTPSSPILYVSDYNNDYVFALDNTGSLSIALGNGGHSPVDNAGVVAGDTVGCQNPFGVAYSAGNDKLYVGCYSSNTVYEIDTTNFQATQVVRSGGTTTNGTAGNGGAARTYRPRGLTVDGSGNVMWIEHCQGSGRGGVLRAYSPAGATLFGNAVTAGNVGIVMGSTSGGCSNKVGAINSLRFDDAWDIALASDGAWVSYTNSDRIMFVNDTGSAITYADISVPAGEGQYVINATSSCTTFNGEGSTGNDTCINDPYGLAVGTDKLYFALSGVLQYRIRNLDLSVTNGAVNTNVGSGYLRNGNSGDTDQAATAVTLSGTWHLAVDKTNRRLYYSDYDNDRIRRVDLSSGVVSNFVGKAGGLYTDNILSTDALVNNASGLAIHSGHLIFGTAQYSGTGINEACLIRTVNTAATSTSLFGQTVFSNSVSTIAGNYSLGCLNNANSAYTGGVLATNVELYNPDGIAVAQDSSGNPLVYFTLYDNHCLMKLDQTGTLSVAMGHCNSQGSASNTDISAASMRFPRGIAQDPLNPENLFVVDQWNQGTQTIRYLNFSASSVTVFTVTVPAGKAHNILTLSGSPRIQDVAAFADQVCYSSGQYNSSTTGNHNVICKDRDLAEAALDTLRCGVPNGSSVKGASPVGDEQEGVSCSSAYLAGPYGLAFDADGNLYIAERLGHLIRMVKKWF